MRLAYAVLFAAALAGGCNSTNAIDIRYHLVGLTPTSIIRVDTLINVDPSDARKFYANQPYREVAQGVGYSVNDLSGSGTLTMTIEFDATLGYQFKPSFDFNLLPPVGESPPKLLLTSRAMGTVDAISNTVVTHAAFGAGPVDVTLMDTRCGGTLTCPANQICCNNGCLAADSDVNNCGGCGTTCGASGDGCSGGQCRCGGGSACASGQSCCAGLGCVDLMNDAFHCGACGKACNPGESCVAGACKCGGAAACTGTNPICCVSGAGAMCSANGTCACGNTSCTAPEICCGGSACKNLANDDANCGKCGNRCTAPLTCSGGACSCNGDICAAGDACCGSGCANLQNDPDHCGDCRTRCATNESCVAGKCVCGTSQCSGGQTCCGTACVNTSSDFSNCGACGHSCKTNEMCVPDHNGVGVCRCNSGAGCTGNQSCCPNGTSGGGGCFDLSNGPEHCGMCSNPPCQQGFMCMTGMCVPSACPTPCTNGNTCVNGTCICMGGSSTAACTGTQQCCLGTGCVDFQTNHDNCGGCGHKCGDVQQCCGATCVPLNDPNNCGQCGKVCTGNTGGTDGGATGTCCLCPSGPQCGFGNKCMCPLPPA